VERQRLVAALAEEYQPDLEARQALMGLIVRVVDDIRFGLRDINVGEIQDLAWAWSHLNDGCTPSEAALRAIKDGE
jgi:hypothetical protein